MRTAGVVLGAAIVLAACYAAGGQAGVFAISGAAALGALLTARLRIPGPPRGRPGSRPARASNAAFTGYRHIEVAMGEARVSPRQFDIAARPVLQRLLAALAAGLRGADMGKETTVAREAMGEDLWPLLDPGRPASGDSRGPGVSLETLAAIVDRLEDL